MRMIALVLVASVACGKSGSSAPAKLYLPSLKQGSAPNKLAVELRLHDAQDHPAKASGYLELEIRDRTDKEPVGGGEYLACQVNHLTVNEKDFKGSDLTYQGELELATPCGPIAPDHLRDGTLVFHPDGGKALPPVIVTPPGEVVPVLPPDGGVAAAATPAASEIVVGPWPVAVNATGMLDKDPADPQAIVVATQGCSVHVIQLDNTTIAVTDATKVAETYKRLLEATKPTFTKTELAADHWHFEYVSAAKKFALHSGLVQDSHHFLCRGFYDTEQQLACGAAICSTLHAK